MFMQSAKMADKGTTKKAYMQEKQRKTHFFTEKFGQLKKKAVPLHAFSHEIINQPTRWGIK